MKGPIHRNPVESEVIGHATQVQATLGFLASVIKSGEEWTSRCDEMYDKAKQSLIKLGEIAKEKGDVQLADARRYRHLRDHHLILRDRGSIGFWVHMNQIEANQFFGKRPGNAPANLDEAIDAIIEERK